MKVLITAGPTREAIDPVRYLSNRSSGRMGYGIAEAALEKGHEVVLVSGPTFLDPPRRAELVGVESARDMFEAVREFLPGCDAAIYCAAVSDYRVREVAVEKIKSHRETWSLELEKTEDVLGSCRRVFGFEGILVGFAAETENLEANARGKLERKQCDLVVANDVSRKDIGFDREDNEVHLFFADGSSQVLPFEKKRVIGGQLIQIIEDLQRRQAR